MRNGMQMAVAVAVLLTLCSGMAAFAQGGPYFVAHEPTDFPIAFAHPFGDLALIDFDHDGDMDIVLSENGAYDWPITYYDIRAIRNEDGVLSDATSEVIVGGTAMIFSSGKSMIVADFDRDGLMDVFLGGNGLDVEPLGGEQSRILMGTAGGNWWMKRRRACQPSMISPTTPAQEISTETMISISI